ncbi:MAG TPA: cation diffusion facilitator family transporter [Methylomirabilota bacterium]|nr:cation diffusion facilitator family transporter [Methylomirabilota bacterium]
MTVNSHEPFLAGERVAKLSVLTLLVIGVVELFVGRLSLSLGLSADGVTSLFDALVSLIVWLGLHFSRRRPDARFHFGYQKVETLAALLVAISMIGVAIYIVFVSYLTFLNPRPISYPAVAMVTLLLAGILSMYRAIQMRTVARKYGLLSLRTDANNSIKDATASFVIFVSILGSSLGFLELDAVGGIIIGIYILGVAYVTIKEASLILLDACESPEMTSELAAALKTLPGISDITSIKLRPSGRYLTGVLTVTVDGSETVADTERLRKEIRDIISRILEPVEDIIVVFRASRDG